MMDSRSISFKDLKYESNLSEFFDKKIPLADVCNTVSAFLNTSGGHLIIGATRDQAFGIDDADQYAQEISDTLLVEVLPLAVWQVDVLALAEKKIIAITVPEGSEKPYVSNRAIWLRNSNQTQRAIGTAVSTLLDRRTEDGVRWERQFTVGADFEDLDIDLIKNTAGRALQIGRWRGDATDPFSFLNSLGLSFEGRITNAAVTLFGIYPSKFLPQTRVRVTGMPLGKTGRSYSFDRFFEASLLSIASELPVFLEDRLQDIVSEFSNDDWKRKDFSSRYPSLALREGVMNALVHRDYFLHSNVQIALQPRALEITSPGDLPFQLKVADLRKNHLSLPRNPDIAHVCFLAGLIEKVGRGTQFIVESCAEANLMPPRWNTSATSTTLTFYAEQQKILESQDVDVEGYQRLSPKLAELLSAFRGTNLGSISVADVTAKLVGGADARAVRYHLEKLVSMGLLKKQGSRRHYTYSLAEKPEM